MFLQTHGVSGFCSGQALALPHGSPCAPKQRCVPRSLNTHNTHKSNSAPMEALLLYRALLCFFRGVFPLWRALARCATLQALRAGHTAVRTRVGGDVLVVPPCCKQRYMRFALFGPGKAIYPPAPRIVPALSAGESQTHKGANGNAVGAAARGYQDGLVVFSSVPPGRAAARFTRGVSPPSQFQCARPAAGPSPQWWCGRGRVFQTGGRTPRSWRQNHPYW